MTIQQMLTTWAEQFAGLAEGFRPEASLEWLQGRHERLGRDLPSLWAARQPACGHSGTAPSSGSRRRRAARLAERAEVFLHLCDGDNAWRAALELDRLRPAFEREREQLACHEDSYAEQRRDIDALKQRWRTCVSAWSGAAAGARDAFLFADSTSRKRLRRRAPLAA